MSKQDYEVIPTGRDNIVNQQEIGDLYREAITLLVADIQEKLAELNVMPDAARIRREEMGTPNRDLLLSLAIFVFYFINNIENPYESLRFLMNLLVFLGSVTYLYKSIKAHERAEERIRGLEEAELSKIRGTAVIIDQNRQIEG